MRVKKLTTHGRGCQPALVRRRHLEVARRRRQHERQDRDADGRVHVDEAA